LFFLSEPPSEFAAMHDFRRLPGQVAGTESPELRFEVRKAMSRREIAIELRAALGWDIHQFSQSASLDDQAEDVGQRIRSSLGVQLEDQFRWQFGYPTFNHWRALVEAQDVLVLQMVDVPSEETRGFTISSDQLPIICLNIKDTPAARCFSLMHEYTHLLLRMGGLCDFDDHTQRPAEDLRAERFCNEVAAAALIPKSALLATPIAVRHRNDDEWPDQDIQAAANAFGVSREALVRRLLTLGRVSDAFYRAKRAQYLEEFRHRQENRPAGFAPPDRIAFSAIGPSFARVVLESYNREQISASALADYLDVRLKHVPAIEQALAGANSVE
jgi:Zn-dependent peptidase ImmA (M78 family)